MWNIGGTWRSNFFCFTMSIPAKNGASWFGHFEITLKHATTKNLILKIDVSDTNDFLQIRRPIFFGYLVYICKPELYVNDFFGIVAKKAKI